MFVMTILTNTGTCVKFRVTKTRLTLKNGIIPVKIILVSLPHNHWDQYMCDMYNNSSDKLNYCWQHPKN